jgi:hypothetical protein
LKLKLLEALLKGTFLKYFFISETFLPILHPIKSVEAALHHRMVRVEKVLDQQETVMGIFMDKL